MKGFVETVLKGQAPPDDLAKLLAWPDDYADTLEEANVFLLEPGEVPDLIDHSYLNDEDRANPDIMANVAAVDEVFTFITFVARTDDGDLIGYWHGPEGVPMAEAPLVKYDTEGQFELMQGTSFCEAIVGDYAFDDQELFDDLREELAEYEIHMAASYDALKTPAPATRPEALAEKLYDENRL